MDVCRCLNEWDIRRIIFINGHGGNLAVLHTLAIKIRKKYDILTAVAQWWDILPRKIDGHITETHGGIIETALMLALNPKIVNLNLAFVPKVKPLTERIQTVSIVDSKFEGEIFHIFLKTRDVSEYGPMTETEDATEIKDFSKATPELGRELLNKVVELITRFVNEFEKVELSPHV